MTAADSYGEEPTEEEVKYCQFIDRTLKPSDAAYLLYQNYFRNPVPAYIQIQSSSDEVKRMIKTFFYYTCACDGPINEGEREALNLLDQLCGFPEMSTSEIHEEYKKILGIE